MFEVTAPSELTTPLMVTFFALMPLPELTIITAAERFADTLTFVRVPSMRMAPLGFEIWVVPPFPNDNAATRSTLTPVPLPVKLERMLMLDVAELPVTSSLDVWMAKPLDDSLMLALPPVRLLVTVKSDAMLIFPVPVVMLEPTI